MIVVPAVTVASVAVSIKRRAVHARRQITSPPERPIDNSVSRNKSESAEPRAPMPTRAPPARPPRTPSARRIDPSRIHVGFCHITRSQTAPAIQIAVLIHLFIELLRLERAVRRKVQLASALYFHLPVSFLHQGLPVIDAHRSRILVKSIHPGLHTSSFRTISRDPYIILRMYHFDFDHCVASLDSNLCVRKARLDHRHGTVVTNSQKYAGRQQNFCLPAFRRQRLARVQLRRSN